MNHKTAILTLHGALGALNLPGPVPLQNHPILTPAQREAVALAYATSGVRKGRLKANPPRSKNPLALPAWLALTYAANLPRWRDSFTAYLHNAGTEEYELFDELSTLALIYVEIRRYGWDGLSVTVDQLHGVLELDPDTPLTPDQRERLDAQLRRMIERVGLTP